AVPAHRLDLELQARCVGAGPLVHGVDGDAGIGTGLAPDADGALLARLRAQGAGVTGGGETSRQRAAGGQEVATGDITESPRKFVTCHGSSSSLRGEWSFTACAPADVPAGMRRVNLVI